MTGKVFKEKDIKNINSSELRDEIMENEKQMRLREKIDFYYREKLKCHITKEPKGFVNGWIRSDLQEGDFYWFEDEHYPMEKLRIFLSDVFDIGDWRPKKGW